MPDIKSVIERRAEMETQCECLAAWVDDYECICNKTMEFPVNAEAVAKANSLIRQINDLDRRSAAVASMGDVILCQVRKVTEFHLPNTLVLAALKAERLGLVRQLSETGVISTNSDKVRAALERE